MRLISKIKNYQVRFVDNILKRKKIISAIISYRKIFYFIDQKVYKIYQLPLKEFIGDDFFQLITATEENKTFQNLDKYYRTLIANGFRRPDVLITIGGGILQDVSGFIASTLYRGIPWIFIPTTLLAQADSCIGSKTSINFDQKKNLIGSFYPPDVIFIDVNFCKTLPQGYFNSGIGEIIKFHFLADSSKFNLLEKFLSCKNLRRSVLVKKMVISTLEIKKTYFEKDEFDRGRRNLLNFGHCFGHALESASHFQISHGEAVTAGMGFANLLSLKREILTKRRYEEFEEILQRFYPRFDISKIDIGDLIYFMQSDKKRTGEYLTMILAKDIGRHIKKDDIRPAEIIETFKDFLKIYPSH